MSNTVNEQGNEGRSVTERLPPRFRLVGPDGKEYAPFRLKPHAYLHQIIGGSGCAVHVARRSEKQN